jgi:hypothetical protein
MSYKFNTLSLFVGLSFLSSVHVNGQLNHCYFISNSGNDSNNGSIDLPWQTFSHAQTISQPGDTVFIRSGVYTMTSPIIITDTGSIDKPVVYAAYRSEKPVFDFSTSKQPNLPSISGQAPGSSDFGIITLYNSLYVTVQGIRVINSPSAGIEGYRSKHIQILNNSTYNTFSSGASAWDCDSVLISGNNIELACNLGPQECISISRSKYFEVSYNEIHNTTPLSSVSGGEGIDCKEGTHYGKVHHNYLHHLERQALYVDSWNQHLSQIEHYNNVVHDCMHGYCVSTEQLGGRVDSLYFHNNLIFNCAKTGILITTWTNDEPRNYIIIENNTVDSCGWKRVAENGFPCGGMAVESQKVTGLVVRNNIFSHNCSFQFAYRYGAQPEITCDYNLIDGYNGNPLRDQLRRNIQNNQTIVAQNFELNYKAPARFVNKNDTDYSLKQTSFAINAGNPDPKYNDPNGTRNDIGAFPSEFIDSIFDPIKNTEIETDTASSIVMSNLKNIEYLVYPNPVSDILYINLGTFDISQNILIDILNGSGRLLYSATYKGGQIIAIDAFKTFNFHGLTVVKINSDKETITRKVLIK